MRPTGVCIQLLFSCVVRQARWAFADTDRPCGVAIFVTAAFVCANCSGVCWQQGTEQKYDKLQQLLCRPSLKKPTLLLAS
jgi:hypothetical protein